MLDPLQIYHRLPYPLRVLAASARGYYLRSWRYGPETEGLVAQALERDFWSAGRWKAWQEERLAFILHRAATRVPYYRSLWEDRRRRGDRSSWEILDNWPILEKEPLRLAPQEFVADDRSIGGMFPEHTSGSSGKPLRLWWSLKTVRAWYALFEARWRRWHGVGRMDPWAHVGGQMVAPFGRTKPPFWVWNAGLNQLYLSSYHLAPAFIPHYLEALKRHRVKYILGYTSSLHALALEILRLGRKDLSLSVAITDAEPILEHQRQAIAEAFQCPVRATYGMAEAAAAAGECREGGAHLWPEAGWLEVMEDGRPQPRGQAGELLATGLLNEDMPLIRYRVGDRAALAGEEPSCPCGRGLPLLARVEGRSDDVLYLRDGRKVGRLDTVFKADLCIREAQIVQESLSRVRIKFVRGPDYAASTGEAMARRLKERLGPVEVVLEEVAMISRTGRGKFQAVLCRIPSEERPK
ncbi:MAG: phenylacetate--CoA ligase family protein [Elusimicrobia bacterium]|nr:phenylacetate--CoA ligase family protein [Elusimicrobiota bacterium]